MVGGSQRGARLDGGERIRESTRRRAAIDPPELRLYYWDGSAISETFTAVRARLDRPIRFAVIGLGTGSLAFPAPPGDTPRYYENDPPLIPTSPDPYPFRFLWGVRPQTPVILRHARLPPP